MATAFDECEEGRNNGGCAPLQDAIEEQRRIRARQDTQGSRLAQLIVTVDHVKDAIDRVESEGKRTAESVDAVRSVVCAPANALLAKYHSSNPPPELLDGCEDISTEVVARYPVLSEQRIRKEKSGRLEAEKRAEALGAEKERIRLAAKLEAARIAEAAKLKEEQVEREKRNARLLHAGLGVLMSLITFLTTWLASRGH